MPVFPQASLNYKGRTNTQLVVSEGNAPAEKYLASEATNADVKFLYEFGPEGNNAVVIPKGKILAFAGQEYDVETEKYVPRVKLASAAQGELLMGVNHHNVYQRRRDRFSGSEPTILTREYIRVPLFTGRDAAAATAAAAAIKFGAMSAAANTQADKNALLGKYVTTDANGNFTVATTPSIENVVGQIYGIETDLPPAGFLQYFLEFNDDQYKEFLRTTSFVPSPGRTTDKAGTLDAATFPVGTGYFKTTQDYAMALKSFRAGIPFLTDGYFKARTSKTYTLATTGVVAKTMGNVTVADNKVSVSDVVGAALFVRLPHDLCKDMLPKYDLTRDVVPSAENYPEFGALAPAGLTVKLGQTSVSAANYHVDYDNNMVVIYFTETIAAEASVAVTITAQVLENQIPGIPTGWDFANNIGEARILLMK